MYSFIYSNEEKANWFNYSIAKRKSWFRTPRGTHKVVITLLFDQNSSCSWLALLLTPHLLILMHMKIRLHFPLFQNYLLSAVRETLFIFLGNQFQGHFLRLISWHLGYFPFLFSTALSNTNFQWSRFFNPPQQSSNTPLIVYNCDYFDYKKST